jgi:hypothetical protein
MVLPAASLAPLNDAVYDVPAASALFGVSVTAVRAVFSVTVAGTAPPGPVSVNAVPVDCTGSLKVALTALVVATPVALAAGVRDVTVGGVVSAPPLNPVVKVTSTQ